MDLINRCRTPPSNGNEGVNTSPRRRGGLARGRDSKAVAEQPTHHMPRKLKHRTKDELELPCWYVGAIPASQFPEIHESESLHNGIFQSVMRSLRGVSEVPAFALLPKHTSPASASRKVQVEAANRTPKAASNAILQIHSTTRLFAGKLRPCRRLLVIVDDSLPNVTLHVIRFAQSGYIRFLDSFLHPEAPELHDTASSSSDEDIAPQYQSMNVDQINITPPRRTTTEDLSIDAYARAKAAAGRFSVGLAAINCSTTSTNDTDGDTSTNVGHMNNGYSLDDDTETALAALADLDDFLSRHHGDTIADDRMVVEVSIGNHQVSDPDINNCDAKMIPDDSANLVHNTSQSQPVTVERGPFEPPTPPIRTTAHLRHRQTVTLRQNVPRRPAPPPPPPPPPSHHSSMPIKRSSSEKPKPPKRGSSKLSLRPSINRPVRPPRRRSSSHKVRGSDRPNDQLDLLLEDLDRLAMLASDAKTQVTFIEVDGIRRLRVL